MLSVVIATHESERALVRTLACLVPGAMAGLVSEVIVADGGSQDETEAVSDVAGCRFLSIAGPLGERLKEGAAAARSDWLLFLSPGSVLESGWMGDVEQFVGMGQAEAATFRPARGAGSGSVAMEALQMLIAAAFRRRSELGLLIAKRLYVGLGGHRASAANPQADLLRRIGSRAGTLRAGLQMLDSVK